MPLGPLVTFFAVQSWAGSIISMSGFDLRQAQGQHRAEPLFSTIAA